MISQDPIRKWGNVRYEMQKHVWSACVSWSEGHAAILLIILMWFVLLLQWRRCRNKGPKVYRKVGYREKKKTQQHSSPRSSTCGEMSSFGLHFFLRRRRHVLSDVDQQHEHGSLLYSASDRGPHFKSGSSTWLFFFFSSSLSIVWKRCVMTSVGPCSSALTSRVKAACGEVM